MAPTPVTYLQPLLPFIVFTCAITLASYYFSLGEFPLDQDGDWLTVVSESAEQQHLPAPLTGY